MGVLSSSKAAPEARRLEKHMEVFDFENALSSLMDIERILGIQTDRQTCETPSDDAFDK